MKTNLLLKVLLEVLLIPVLFTSCKKEEDYPIWEWDFAPVVIAINVVDESGNNLMDPATENSIAGNEIKITFRGKTYNLDEEPKSRAYMPEFRGLYSFDKYREDFQYGLFFGELARDDNYDEEIVIDWGDGSKNDIIVFNHRFWWEKDNPKSETTYLFNGKKVIGEHIIIKK